MKHFMMALILASLTSGMAFADESSTDCQMMSESNERSNPKSNSNDKVVKEKPKSSSTSAQ